jgi:hypothetical protein
MDLPMGMRALSVNGRSEIEFALKLQCATAKG